MNTRAGFLDFFKQFVPSPRVPETEGILGDSTKKVNDFDDDGVDDDDLDALQEAADHDEDEELEPEDGFTFVDLTKEPRPKKRGRSKGKRKWKNVKGITLHQTAVDFGSNPRRLINVPAHGATLRDGKIVLLHTPTDYMWHAHSLNKNDIGIEVSCRAAGIEGIGSTFWRSESDIQKGRKYDQLVKEAADIQIAATRELCRYYIELVEKNGGKIEYIHAHRQGHKSRVSDPGSRIWDEVAVPLMEEFGLSCGPVGWKAGSGHPIPQVWDEKNGRGIPYSWKTRGF